MRSSILGSCILRECGRKGGVSEGRTKPAPEWGCIPPRLRARPARPCDRATGGALLRSLRYFGAFFGFAEACCFRFRRFVCSDFVRWSGIIATMSRTISPPFGFA